MKKQESTYKVLSRFYSGEDQFEESYVVKSRNDGIDTRFDIGEIVRLIKDEGNRPEISEDGETIKAAMTIILRMARYVFKEDENGKFFCEDDVVLQRLASELNNFLEWNTWRKRLLS